MSDISNAQDEIIYYAKVIGRNRCIIMCPHHRSDMVCCINDLWNKVRACAG